VISPIFNEKFWKNSVGQKEIIKGFSIEKYKQVKNSKPSTILSCSIIKNLLKI